MVTIGMNYRVREGKEKIFEDAFDRVLVAMGGIEGHDRSALYRGITNPGEYLIVSRWVGEDAFDAFIASDTFKKVVNWGSEHILAGPPSHTTYRES